MNHPHTHTIVAPVCFVLEFRRARAQLASMSILVALLLFLVFWPASIIWLPVVFVLVRQWAHIAHAVQHAHPVPNPHPEETQQ